MHIPAPIKQRVTLLTDVVELDEVDKELLQSVQDEFPVSKSPWKRLAHRLNISEEETLARVQRLHREGVIRKIAPVLENREVWLNASTLILMKVPKERIDEIAEVINSYDGVTHNYEREHEYNLWFTLTTSNEDELRRTLNEIKEAIKIPDTDILDLPVTRRFKIGVRYQFK